MKAWSTLSDPDLLALLKSDSQDAYVEIYNRYERLLFIHAYKILRNREDARDLVQELFASFWANRHEIVIKANLSAYFYTAIRNRVFDLMAHQKVKSNAIVSLQAYLNKGHQPADYQTRYNQLHTLIEKEIAQLPTKMRIIFEMSRKEQISHREIADKLGLSESTVKKQFQNSLKILKGKLGPLFVLLYLF